MIQKLNGDPERFRFGFVAAVESAFAFLMDHGFVLYEMTPTLVQYRAGKLRVNVYHDRSSYELGFEVGREDECYTLSEIISVADPEAGEKYRNVVIAKPALMAAAVERLADLVREYGGRALEGDSSFYELLRMRRQEWSESYALDVLARRIRPEAEAAFREGRYREASELYAQIEDRLSTAELKKLNLARRRSV